MPQLIRNGQRSDETLDIDSYVAAEEWQEGQPLLLAVDDEPLPEHRDASAIAINFAAFNDGRGLSLAVLLRRRIGFTGDLCAVGDVHHDLAHYLARCGFSSMLLPDGRDVDVALNAVATYSEYYQPSVLEPKPLIRRLQGNGAA